MTLTTTTKTTYFKFEEDFVENNTRCIPMAVRLKLDLCGIKLKLAEWSRFSVKERADLSERSCDNAFEIVSYRTYLQKLVMERSGHEASGLKVTEPMEWNLQDRIPEIIELKLREFQWSITLSQWNSLSILQRFALVKLSRPGHENANFPPAMKEFGLLNG